ncbi:MAG: S9 family peptidase [Gammaproteobacteria bacterium]
MSATHAARLLAKLIAISVISLRTGDLLAVEQVPTELFFKNPEFTTGKLSPDGQKLAVLRNISGDDYDLIVFNLRTGSLHQITALDGVSVYQPVWLNSDRLIFRFRESRKWRNGLYIAGLDGEPATYIGPGFAGWIWPGRYLGLDDDEAIYLSTIGGQIIRCRPDKDVRPLGGSIPATARFDSAVRDNQCIIRAYHYDGVTYYRSSVDDDWRELDRYKDAEGYIELLAFDSENNTIIVGSDIGRKTRAVFSLDPDTGELGEMIYGDDTYDVQYPLISDDDQSLIGVAYMADTVRFIWLEERRAKLAEALAAVLPEFFHSFQFSDDGKTALVMTFSDRDPGGYWLYDDTTGTLKELFKSHEWIRPEQMAAVEPVEFSARDGTTIRGYLTLPLDTGDARPPLIVYPHGGPNWVRDIGVFDGAVQFFANRGFAVLQVDFRGSGGYGREFVEAGMQQWGDAIQDDITDGVRWVIDQGYVDPEQICIYGGSFGGYAALMGPILEPDLYRCAVSFAGVSDLSRIAWASRRGGTKKDTWTEKQIGDYRKDAGKLARSSPANRAEEMPVPVMLLHGKKDGIVDWSQSRLMEKRLKRAGKPVEVMYFDDEGHGLGEQENRVAAHEAIVAFIRKNISSQPAAQ